jgi:hypothetical protein
MKINKKLTEQEIIEHCLMLYHSGYEFMHLLGFYAFDKGWNLNKLLYYVKLIKEEKRKEIDNNK